MRPRGPSLRERTRTRNRDHHPRSRREGLRFADEVPVQIQVRKAGREIGLDTAVERHLRDRLRVRYPDGVLVG